MKWIVGRTAVGSDDRMQVIGGSAVNGVVEHRGCRGNQPLVVEERATERRLEEVVGDGVPRRVIAMEVLVDRQCSGVVVTLGQPDGVASRRVAVHLSTVDLILVLVVPV